MTKSRGVGRGHRQPIHGHSSRKGPSPTYNSWRGMVDRCRPGKQYGKRGITVCERWRTFQNFLADMGERPTGFEIDRKDAAGNYEPDNCQWLLKRTNRQYRTATKLTPDVRASIDELHSKGMFHRQIAAEIGVSKSAVSDYLRGDHW